MKKSKKISIIIPCLNEEEGIGLCLEEAAETIRKNNLDAEIIVVDNNSTDSTKSIVSEFQGRMPNLLLVSEEKAGYGSAYLKGFSAASGEYIFMSDGDGTYDFAMLPEFIREAESGSDLVVGNRFASPEMKRAMPWLHRVVGNPALSFLVRTFFGARITDVHCGMRLIKKEALERINLNTLGMEFASEMVIKAAKKGLAISQIDIPYRPRRGVSKLRSWSDGWRHLRFILLYSPLLLFLLPGLLVFTMGVAGLFAFYFGKPSFLGIDFYIHPMFAFAVMIILGYQLIAFSAFSKIYAINHLGDRNKFVELLFQKITIERAGILGLLLVISGLLIYGFILFKWLASDFGTLDEIKNSIAALTLLVVGVQTFFSAFMFSTLGIKDR